MNYILSGAKIYINGKFELSDLLVSDGVVKAIGAVPFISDACVIDCKDNYIFPGFADVHVHLREPGFFYKETIETGTKAAAHGGYTSVCSMPNLKPAPDCLDTLKVQLEIIKKSAVINVHPYGTITKGENGEELSDMEAISDFVAGFSDDGRGVQNEEMMKSAMLKAKTLGKIIVAHCEDNSLLHGGYIHDGEYARLNNHKGICSESEWKPIERDLRLVKETGCAYHVCHISTKESVELIRKAKADGLNITCETAPHYLVFCDMEIEDDGKFKMNPPIRSENDKKALLDGIKDGTIDMIATDHAPHSAEEKSKGLKNSAMGIVGLETAFPILYTNLVKSGIITLERLIELLSINPRNRFLSERGITVGKSADLTVFNLNSPYVINENKFLSKGKCSPFIGKTVFGKCIMTMVGGKFVWQEKQTEKLY